LQESQPMMSSDYELAKERMMERNIPTEWLLQDIRD
jgi:hypothetical protein